VASMFLTAALSASVRNWPNRVRTRSVSPKRCFSEWMTDSTTDLRRYVSSSSLALCAGSNDENSLCLITGFTSASRLPTTASCLHFETDVDRVPRDAVELFPLAGEAADVL